MMSKEDVNKSQSFRDRKLYLNKEDAKLEGVASGLADYLGVDATLVRIVFIALGLRYGLLMVIFYHLASWLMDENPNKETKSTQSYYEDGGDTCQWEQSSKVDDTETTESKNSYYTEQEEYDLEDIQVEEEPKDTKKGSYLIEVDDVGENAKDGK